MTAAVISPDPRFRDGLSKTLARVSMLAAPCATVSEFVSAFNGECSCETTPGPGRAASYAVRCPDVLVVESDAEDPDCVRRLALVESLLRREPRHEVLAALGGDDADHKSRLVQYGAGTIVSKHSWQEAEPEIVSEARRLAEISDSRWQRKLALQLALLRSTSLQRPDTRTFLCHDRADAQIGFGVRRFLEQNGIRAWYSATDVEQAAFWHGQALAKLAESTAFIALITERWVPNGNCWLELQEFCAATSPEDGERVIPFVLDPSARAHPKVQQLLRRFTEIPDAPTLWERLQLLLARVRAELV